jgi:hypothetical protein
MTTALLNKVRALRRGLAGDGGCRCRPLVLDRGGPWGTAQAPPSCPNCGRPPRLLEVDYGTDFYNRDRLGATTS